MHTGVAARCRRVVSPPRQPISPSVLTCANGKMVRRDQANCVAGMDDTLAARCYFLCAVDAILYGLGEFLCQYGCVRICHDWAIGEDNGRDCLVAAVDWHDILCGVLVLFDVDGFEWDSMCVKPALDVAAVRAPAGYIHCSDFLCLRALKVRHGWVSLSF